MTEPWDLPEGWEWATFQEVAQIASDLVSPAVHQDEPHIAPNHIESGSGRLLPYTTIAADKVTSPKHRFRPGQILYSKIRPYLCKAVRVDFAGLCSADMYPITAKIDAGYLHRWMLSLTFTEWASGAQGRTVLPKINQEALSVIQVPVPPLAEQRRIVAKVEELTARSRAARVALDEMPTLLEQFRQSVLASAFRGDLTADWRAKNPTAEPATVLLDRIRNERRKQWEAKYPKKTYTEPDPVDDSDLPELPEGWCWASWNELAEWITYGFTRPMPHVEAGPRIITAKNVQDGEITFGGAHRTTTAAFAELSDKDRPKSGDILITKDGTIGRAAIVQDGEPFCINQSVAVVWMRGCQANRNYLLRAIQAPFTQSRIAEAAQGMAIQHLSITDFGRFPFPLAPLAEQDAVVERLNASLTTIGRSRAWCQDTQADLDQLDQSILAKAFRGELVPQDPADEPASVLLERIRSGSTITTPAARSVQRGRAKFYVLLLLRTWKKPLGREMLERGLVLMLNPNIRRDILNRTKPNTRRSKPRKTEPHFVRDMPSLIGEMLQDGQLVPGPEAGFFAEGQHDIDFTAAPEADFDAVRETAEAMKVIQKDKNQAMDAEFASQLNGEVYEFVS